MQLKVSENTKPEIDRKPGWWFWLAIILGIAIRIYLVVFTEGTYDAHFWQNHAASVHQYGLIEYYHTSPVMNHPPLISVIASGLWDISQATGIPFRILFRAPFALLDGCTALLLLRIFSENRRRFVIAACYWLHPLAIIFSSFHGNTDSAIAFSLLLSLWLLSKEKTIWAAAAIGASFWVKLPGIMAIPAFVFFLQGWRKRLLFLAVIGLVGVSTYLPAIIKDAPIVYRNIFGYHGVIIKTNSGIPIWGCYTFFVPLFNGLPPGLKLILNDPFFFALNHSWFISILLIVLLSWLRRSQKTVEGLGVTIAAAYTIIYGFSNSWAFQYLAWSIPFWFFTPLVFLLSATLLAGGYIYSLYWLLCGNPWLLGDWDFIPHPDWPMIVIALRNLSVVFFFISACIFLVNAVLDKITRQPIKDHSKRIVRRSKRPLG